MVEKGKIDILADKYMIAHFPNLVQALYKKKRGGVMLVL